MKKTTSASPVRYIDDNTAQVTKAFKKQACIFGTNEFKLWREYLTVYPDAKMITKSIKKNHAKKTRNKKYDNMKDFINTLPNSEVLMEQFETVLQRSKIKNHPYGYVLEWFETHVEPYGDFDTFIVNKAAEAEADTSAAAETPATNRKEN